MTRYILLLTTLLSLSLSACAAKQALDDMKSAKAEYQACRADHPNDPAACKREKEIYEDAGQSYDRMSGKPGNNDY